MHFTSLQVLVPIVTMCFMLSSVYADETSGNPDEHFKSICLEAWMSRAAADSDKVKFKNFGEKYCQCGTTKTYKDENDVKRMVQLCMSETLTQTIVNMLEGKQELSNVSLSGIETACQNEWQVVYPKMSEENKKASMTHCQCVAPKLDDLNKNRQSLTILQWVNKLNLIADNCATLISLESS